MSRSTRRRPRADVTYGVATDAVLTDTAIVTSGGVPNTRYQRLVTTVERAINEADPIRLRDVGAPTDEYSPEIATILPRLAGVQGFSDVIDVLHEEFVRWFDEFLPTIKSGDDPLLRPVAVTDVTDGKLVHLAGLDLSRAWCLEGVAQGLQPGALRDLLHRSAEEHLAAGLEYVFSGHYEGEHWLATFAIYAMSESGARR